MEDLEFFAGVDWGSETHRVCIVDGESALPPPLTPARTRSSLCLPARPGRWGEADG